ncbi:unnamed protein product [Cunninghamella blakesleeana]
MTANDLFSLSSTLFFFLYIYGRLVRCDIPAPKSFSSKPYAFVEFEDPRDAEDAFNEMHARRIDGYTISVQWARNAPSSSWRFDRSPRHHRSPSPYYSRRHSYGRSPSRSPYHRGRSPPPYHHDGLSPLRGRSPPPLHLPLYDRNNSRLSHSRSPPPSMRHHDDYPAGTVLPPPLPSSNNDHQLSSKSPSYYRGGGVGTSHSPQRRSLSPRRSRSPEP